MESHSFIERPWLAHRNSAPASPSSSSFSKSALKKLFTRTTWHPRTSKRALSTFAPVPTSDSASRSSVESEYGLRRPRSSWEDVRRRRADALASLGLLEQSAIYGESYYDDEDDEHGIKEDEVVDIGAAPEAKAQISADDPEPEPEHGPLCLCCGVIGYREPPVPGEDSEELFESHSEFVDSSDEIVTTAGSEALLSPVPTTPQYANPKRQGRLFVQVRLELLPPSPVSPSSESPLLSAPGHLEPVHHFSKPPRLSLRICTDSFSTTGTFWDREDTDAGGEPSQSQPESESGGLQEPVRLRKIKSILADIDTIEDEHTRKLTEMAFLS